MGGLSVAQLQAHCLSKPGAWADNPWEHDHPVIKVGEAERGKIFAFLGETTVGSRPGPRARRPTSGWRATPTTPA